MVDENKIRLMTRLARYESGDGKEELRIVKNSFMGYLCLGFFKNFILTTLGYFMVWGFIIAYNMDYLLDNIHKVQMSVVLVEFLVGYLVFLILYSFLVYAYRLRKYNRAKSNVKKYYAGLSELASNYYKKNDPEKEKIG